MTYPEPQKIDTVTKVGWAFTGLVFLGLLYCVFFVEPLPPPDPHTFRRVPDVVNTANIIDVQKEGDFTRVWYSAKSKWLYVEPPEHFMGPTRIVTATRLDQ
jgi:hypothetical protein